MEARSVCLNKMIHENIAEESDNDEMGKLCSMDESITSDEETSQPNFAVDETKRRPGLASFNVSLLAILVSLLCQLLVAPRILHRAGVTETDILEDFVATSVMPHLESGWGRMNGSTVGSYWANERSRPGYKLAQDGAKANYPVIIIPGFVTSGLELWGGEECARKHFRQRLWGSLAMARTALTDRDCWRRHLALDPLTGSDPDKIRLRASQGFEAADYFLATYWVWGKMIENLADVGYDGSTMAVMSYDWRLAFPILEERDGYLTKLKHTIEAYYKSTGKKVVLMSHSMGTSLALYFFAWVTRDEAEGGGGGGMQWVDQHVQSFLNIAGTVLGVPKAAPALLSGEMKDTTVLLGPMGTMAEHFFGRKLRKDLWNTWGSLWAMLPKGGNGIWGAGADLPATAFAPVRAECNKKNSDSAHSVHRDSQESPVYSSPLVSMTDNMKQPDHMVMAKLSCAEVNSCRSDERTKTVEQLEDLTTTAEQLEYFSSVTHHSVEETLNFLQKWGGGYGPTLSGARMHSFSQNEIVSQNLWHDPTSTPLPNAPDLKIYCMYGVGLDTERSYYYKKNCAKDPSAASGPENLSDCNKWPLQDPPFVLDIGVNDASENVRLGVRFSDGDGTVPLVSLGYMCVDGWARPELGYNPSGSSVTTREYVHRQGFQVDDPMRGGPESADHVDILGNDGVTEDVLRIVTGHKSSAVTTHIVSDIEGIARRINAHPSGGLRSQGRSIWEGCQKIFSNLFLGSKRKYY